MENNIDQQKNNHLEELTNEEGLSELQPQIIPVLEEEYSISKETSVKEAKIEKRWVSKTKTVKLPITHEEVYINGKKMKSAEERPWLLSALKEKIGGIGSSSNPDISVKQSVSKKSEVKDNAELVPLSIDNNSSETEKVIPLWAEEIEVNKKMVKVAEIVIKKRKVTEKKNIDIDIKKEEVTIKYSDGITEQL
jgi:stress response protein YsnF